MSSAPIADSASPLVSGGGSQGRSPSMADVRGRLLLSVVELLEAYRIPYCILHGYREYPARVPSDVDCIMPPDFLPHQLAALLSRNRDRLGADLVQWIQHESTAHYHVLATGAGEVRWEFLALDVSSDFRADGRVFYTGKEILDSRSRDRGFWAPSPALEFTCYLVKKVSKRSLSGEHGRRLTELYHKDPTGCDREIARFWRRRTARLIGSVAASGDWDAVRELLPSLRTELLWPRTVREASFSVRYWAADAARRFRRWQVPTGVHVVLLGADGSGKSTTLSALGDALAPAFRRVTTNHLAPALFRGAGANLPVTAPHSCPPRSFVGSLAKAAYWVVDYTLGYYVKIRPALVRSTLVLFDRYLLDALVDVLRGRKQEVSPHEIERQRHAYRQLVDMLPNGHIVDAAQPPDRVIRAVGMVVLGFLASRTLGRLRRSTWN